MPGVSVDSDLIFNNLHLVRSRLDGIVAQEELIMPTQVLPLLAMVEWMLEELQYAKRAQVPPGRL